MASVKAELTLRLFGEDGTPLEVVPLTPEMLSAIQSYLAELPHFSPGSDGWTVVELPVLTLGWAVLRALELPEPTSLLDDAAVTTRGRQRRRRSLPLVQRLRVMLRDGGRCVVCGSTEDLTIDHKMPVSKGGTDDDGNLQTMCRLHNSEKGATLS